MRIYYRPLGSSVGVSGSPAAMYSLWWLWFMITLTITMAGLLVALTFGSCWILGRLTRPKWPRASAEICMRSGRAARAVLRAIDAVNGHPR
jgi:ABC-type amino acid transport system permease subunit